MTHTQKICDCNSTWFHALDSTGLNRVEKLVSLARWQVSQDFKLIYTSYGEMAHT